MPAAPAIDLCAPWSDPRKPHESPVSHLEWAENITRLEAVKLGLGARTQQADDLVAVLHALLVRLAARFDPARVPAGGSADGQFRGMCHRWIKKECKREEERLRNHGLYRTTDDK